ncbi:MAG: hypothetical protein HC822_08870 [Oscillochloris sp.]|nr:hypothetical protein [Oscillochloris sp.]
MNGTERDLFLAKAELNRRLQWAAEERKARAARRNEDTPTSVSNHGEKRDRGGFSWLRRLAGARR